MNLAKKEIDKSWGAWNLEPGDSRMLWSVSCWHTLYFCTIFIVTFLCRREHLFIGLWRTWNHCSRAKDIRLDDTSKYDSSEHFDNYPSSVNSPPLRDVLILIFFNYKAFFYVVLSNCTDRWLRRTFRSRWSIVIPPPHTHREKTRRYVPLSMSTQTQGAKKRRQLVKLAAVTWMVVAWMDAYRFLLSTQTEHKTWNVFGWQSKQDRTFSRTINRILDRIFNRIFGQSFMRLYLL